MKCEVTRVCLPYVMKAGTGGSSDCECRRQHYLGHLELGSSTGQLDRCNTTLTEYRCEVTASTAFRSVNESSGVPLPSITHNLPTSSSSLLLQLIPSSIGYYIHTQKEGNALMAPSESRVSIGDSTTNALVVGMFDEAATFLAETFSLMTGSILTTYITQRSIDRWIDRRG
ncbi:hypothetical protein EVAR_48810_1 [Eumeta japonica]|uniref:Uncharacterized protein n=1 Tax=Eumeta variegata TaxID=151549 RepID=A0A4C1Y236_EUMVA|nr:hypothetical protein EVAR_48810_1 [Eumeta japonica]